MGTEWILAFLEPTLMEFWKKSDKYDWLESQQLSEKEQQARIVKVKFYSEKMVDILCDYVRETNFEKEFVQFLAQITQNFEFPPDKYYFNFEISRLEFTSFAALKNMD